LFPSARNVIIKKAFPDQGKRRRGQLLTIFIEYKVIEEKRDSYLQQLRLMPERLEVFGARGYRCYEGADQPHLFVETFEVETEEQYHHIKAWRLDDRDFCDCVLGGAAKVHVWAFRPIE
jgi:hypothetical protein